MGRKERAREGGEEKERDAYQDEAPLTKILNTPLPVGYVHLMNFEKNESFLTRLEVQETRGVLNIFH